MKQIKKTAFALFPKIGWCHRRRDPVLHVAIGLIGPLAMGAVSDAMGHPKYRFILVTGFAALLFLGLFFN